MLLIISGSPFFGCGGLGDAWLPSAPSQPKSFRAGGAAVGCPPQSWNVGSAKGAPVARSTAHSRCLGLRFISWRCRLTGDPPE